jgi:hypothetical protein
MLSRFVDIVRPKDWLKNIGIKKHPSMTDVFLLFDYNFVFYAFVNKNS